ncbi:MAG: hypothetical protein OEW09_05275 [Anaerolineae bacterium]|nr:hypothetical protein [Anaerolineae bacterium]
MNPGAAILVSIATALATSIITFLLYTPKLRADIEKELRSQFMEQKWQTYTQFAELIPQLMKCEAVQHTPLHERQETAQALAKLTGQMFIVGSPEVQKAFIEWIMHHIKTTEGSESDDTTSFALAKLLMAMRLDLGCQPETGTFKDLLTILNSIEPSTTIRYRENQ